MGFQVAPVQPSLRTPSKDFIEIPAAAPVGIEADLLLPRTVQQGFCTSSASSANGGIETRNRSARPENRASGDNSGNPVPPRGRWPSRRERPASGTTRCSSKTSAAQAVALAACPIGIVEGEHPRGQIRNADAAVGTGVFLTEEQFIPAGQLTETRPSASREAVSRESRSRFLIPSRGRGDRRLPQYHDASALSRTISSPIPLSLPSTRMRIKPSLSSFRSSLWNSPSCP